MLCSGLPKDNFSVKGMDTLSGKATQLDLSAIPSEKVSTLKGKNLLPLGANSSLLENTPFQKEFEVQI